MVMAAVWVGGGRGEGYVCVCSRQSLVLISLAKVLVVGFCEVSVFQTKDSMTESRHSMG